MSLVSIAAKVSLSTLSVCSYDLVYILHHVVEGWRTLVPWLLMVGPLYELWLVLPVDHTDLHMWINGAAFPSGASSYLLALMLKLPILVADVLCAFVIWSIVADRRGRGDGALAAAFWLLNPYVLLTGEMQGSIELIPVTLTVLAIFLFQKKRVSLGSLVLALGVALKLFPIVLMPAVSIYYLKLRKFREFLMISVGVFCGLVLYVLWISSYGLDFVGSLLLYTPFTTVASEFALSPHASTIGLAAVSALAFCFALYMYWDPRHENLFDVVLGFLLAYMAFYDWAPQYLLWLIPFMTVDFLVWGKGRRLYFVVLLISAFFFSLVEFEFAPMDSAFYVPALTNELKTLSEFLQRIHRDVIMVLVASPILRSTFAGVAVVYSAEILVKNSPHLRTLLDRTEYE